MPIALATALVALLQVGILAVLAVAVRQGNGAAAVNALGAFVLTVLPTALSWLGPAVVLGPELLLWLAAAGLVHSVGMLGPYDSVWWWDHLTHTLSAALVAALVYAAALVALPAFGLPVDSATVAAVTVGLTFGAGVFWELLEILARAVGERYGVEPVLVQYGWRDTVADLVFDVVGAVLVVALDVRVFLGLAERLPGTSRAVLLVGGVVLAGSLVVGLLVWARSSR
ncbi:MAG: hypothetical protein V5A30_05635 [Haloarculaceae archaeon]